MTAQLTAYGTFIHATETRDNKIASPIGEAIEPYDPSEFRR